MNKLQKLALRHIRELTDSMSPHLPAYQLAKGWTDDECRKRDQEEYDKWQNLTDAIEEVQEWADALVEG